MIDVPDWFNKEKITSSLDAIPIVNGGGHPLDIVVKAVRQLEENQIYELITPFLPVPLIDKVNAMGFESWTNQMNDDIYKTYFIKR